MQSQSFETGRITDVFHRIFDLSFLLSVGTVLFGIGSSLNGNPLGSSLFGYGLSSSLLTFGLSMATTHRP